MLVGLFQRHASSTNDMVLERRWNLPESFVRYRSRECVIAADRMTAVARTSSGRENTARPGIVAVCDGRLDNREELLERCGLPAGATISDSALICALYARAGRECARDVSGEVRFVLYDEHEQMLMASVDFACTRRLWWREHGSVVIIGSNIGSLYAADESIRINEDYLIERLVYGWNSGRHGPFEEAARLLPGETLCASTRGLVVRKYWCPTMFVASDSATRKEEDCLAEFAHLLRDGVQRRIPRDSAVLCELSGGLDSTTITTLAGGILSDDPRARLHAVTVSYPGAPHTDERGPAERVARAAGAVHHVLEWHASEALFGGMPENAFYWDEPRFNVHSHAMALAKHRLLRSIGANVVLSGAGAEPVLCEDMAWPVFLADSLARGRWREVRSGLSRWQSARKTPFAVLLYRACLGPLLRPATAMTYEARQVAPQWVTRRAKRRYEQLRAMQLGPVTNRRNVAGAWMAEQWQAAGSAADQGYGVYAYETRFPFLHKPLVESVLRMPWSVRVVPNVNKLLLRRLATGLLPSGFAKRASPGADQAIGHALAAQGQRVRAFTKHMVLGQLGLVDEERFQHSVSLVQNGFGRGLRFIVTTLAVELWARSVLSGDWQRMQAQHLWPR